MGIAVSYWDIIRLGAQYDDSYITYRYAVNVAEGRGLTFNTYERVNSASSFLYTILLAFTFRLGLHNMEWVAAAINMAAGAICLVVAFYLCVQVARSATLSSFVLLPIAVSGAWTGWAASGMDTLFYGLLVLLCVWAYANDRHALGVGMVVACILCRPEGVLMWFSILMAEASALPRDIRRLGRYTVAGAVALVLLYGFFWAYFSDWIPQPLKMKNLSIYYSPGLGTQSKHVAGFLVGRFAALSIPSLFAVGMLSKQLWSSGRLVRGRPGFRVELLLAFFLTVSLVSFLIGPHSALMRYSVHVLPILAIVSASLWPEMRNRLPRSSLVGIATLFAIVAVPQCAAEVRITAAAFHKWGTHQLARKQLGTWLETNVPGRGLVLSSDLGAIAYEAKSHDFYDVLGLLTKAPLTAAAHDRWNDVVLDVKERAPAFVSDTVMPDGKISAFRVLNEPEKYFRTVTKNPQDSLRYSTEIIRLIPCGEYKFVVARLK